MSKTPKDLVIERLQTQIEEYKKKMDEFGFENLTQQISDLKDQLTSKESEIQQLQSLGQSSDPNQLRTKMIILQSKVRKLEGENADLKKQCGNLEIQAKLSEKSSGDIQQIELLKRQVRQEQDTADRLRNEINRLSQQSNDAQLQNEIANLQQQLFAAQQQLATSMQGGSAGRMNPAAEQQFRQAIAERDQRIQQLEQQLTQAPSGGGGGPMANLRLQREISALKSQLDMLKKSETDMRRKYEQAMRSQDFTDGW